MSTSLTTSFLRASSNYPSRMLTITTPFSKQSYRKFTRVLIRLDTLLSSATTRAKLQGKHVGRRPKLSEEELKRVKELLSLGVPKKRIAELLDVSRTTLYRYLKKYEK